MNTIAAPVEPRSRLKLLPILVTAALAVAVPYGGAYVAILCHRLLGTPSPRGALLPWLYMQHGFQLALALLVIAVLKRWLAPADYGRDLTTGGDLYCICRANGTSGLEDQRGNSHIP